MKRIDFKVRPDWEKKVEAQGLVYHHTQDRPYWDESAYYCFTAKEVDLLEAATNELQRMALEAGQYIIDNKRYKDLGIPANVVPYIEWAWKNEPPAIYGRMDLAYNGKLAPKLLEYNADTPTALLEAAVVQWDWLQEVAPNSDQFNSIHERLIAKWKELTVYVSSPLYFAHMADISGEDTLTTNYLVDTATQAGLSTERILINDIGWSPDTKGFYDMSMREIRSIFKLYPWEWMVHERFGDNALKTLDRVQWIEPIWKMLWSNKGILPILWEMYPKHDNLLEAYFDGSHQMEEWVKKPKLSREGANVEINGPWTGSVASTGGDYGEEGFIWQARGPVFSQFEKYGVLGSWVVDGQAAGIGIRESNGPITDNQSSFVPHLFE